jgi:hypothetical protein
VVDDTTTGTRLVMLASREQASRWRGHGLSIVGDPGDQERLSGEVALAHLDVIAHTYLDDHRLTCCSMQGGFEISIDGQVWYEEIDELRMSANWLSALRDVMARPELAEQRADAWVWEQSRLTLVRRGRRLSMWDDDLVEEVDVPIDRFAQAFQESGRQFAALVGGLRERARDALRRARSISAAGGSASEDEGIAQNSLLMLDVIPDEDEVRQNLSDLAGLLGRLPTEGRRPGS